LNEQWHLRKANFSGLRKEVAKTLAKAAVTTAGAAGARAAAVTTAGAAGVTTAAATDVDEEGKRKGR